MRLAILTALFFLLFSPFISGNVEAASTSYNVKVNINNERIHFPDQSPFISNTGRTYVPVRFVTEGLGAAVDWNQQKKVVIIKKDGKTIEAPVGSSNPTVDGSVVHLDSPVRLISGRTFVPLRFMSQAVGNEVKWDNISKTVNIIKDSSSGEFSPGSTVKVTASVLNIRSGPAASENITGQVNEGDKLSIIDSSGDWYKVQIPGSEKGWASGKYLELASDSENYIHETHDNEGKQVVVSSNVLNVRNNPGTSNNIIGQVRRGDILPLLGSSRGWFEVSLSGGRTGWVAGWHVEVHNADDDLGPVNGVVNATNVNVRSGPGKNHNVVTQVNRGEQMGVLEKIGDWYKIKLVEGSIGWIYDSLLNISKAEASIPVEDEYYSSDWRQLNSKLTNLDVREVEGRTAVTISMDGPMDYDVFALTNPDRVVVDLKGVIPGNINESTRVNSNLVTQIRTGEHSKNPNILRIVFDTKKAVMFSIDKTRKNNGTEFRVDLYIPDLKDNVKGRTIVLDPGHGGSDSGAVGSSGLKEKDVNLEVGKLASNFLRENGARVVMTRNSDRYVGLEERTRIAQRNDADIFISIHMNGNPSNLESGTSMYYRRSPGSNQANNEILSQQMQAQLILSLNRSNVGVRQANFVVLRTASMPATLIEASFITNPVEEKLLGQDHYQLKIAEAIAKGTANYFTVKQ